jgi:hypothetical protein
MYMPVLPAGFVAPCDVVFRHACQLGFEGIVSKRLGSPYVSGRSRHWVKSKNPKHPAVKREAEEDWAKRSGGSQGQGSHLNAVTQRSLRLCSAIFRKSVLSPRPS